MKSNPDFSSVFTDDVFHSKSTVQEAVVFSPFMHPAWLQGICSLYKLKVRQYTLLHKGNPMSVYNVFYRNRRGNKFMVHPSMTPYNGPEFIRPQGWSDEKFNKIQFQGLEYFGDEMKRDFVYPYFFLGTVFSDVRPFTWRNWQVRPAYTLLVHPESVKPDSDIIRRARRCAEEGFSISFEWNPGLFNALFRKTMARQGINVSYSDEDMIQFLDSLHDAGIAWMITAMDKNGEPHASWVQLQSGPTEVFNWNSATNLDFPNSGGTSYLVINLIEHLRKNKVKMWDLCGADTPSVANFKANIGGQLAVYYKVAFSQYAIKDKLWYRLINR